MEINN